MADERTGPAGERVLVLAPTARDAEITRRVFAEAGLPILSFGDLASLCEEMGRDPAVAVLTEEAIVAPGFDLLARIVEEQPPWSDIPLIILTSGGASSPMIARAVETLGNVTLQERPVRVAALVSAVRSALRARRRQHQIREHLAERERYAAERERLLGEAQAAREQAEAANRMKDEFLATLSHELRTPLNAILGWARILLADGHPDPEDLAEGLAAIERNSKVQAQLIEDLLDVSRIISGKLRLEVQPVDLIAVIEAALSAVTPAAEGKGVRILKTLDSLAGHVSGDPARLQQVVWNLLSNAVKFTPPGGKVRVLLERVNSHVEVSVVDSGMGIKPEFLPYVFDRFRQADGSTTRRHGGLGIGLSIVKQLIDMHGGSVRVKSPGEGRGATFTVMLPISVVQESPQGPGRAAPADQDAAGLHAPADALAGVRVLVVDDEPDARALVRRVLAGKGAEVRVAGSAAEALGTLGGFQPNVVVSDVGMPDRDGHDLMRAIRSGGWKAKDVPSVALTAFARAEDRRMAMLAGFQAHVAKPVDPAELVAVVASLAGRTGGR